MENYNPQGIEPKWQKYWEDNNFYQAKDPDEAGSAKKFFVLVEFPYPSGEGLHVGHCRSFSALDALARKRRMEGWNVLFPIGWDAFGLPAENFAIKTGIHPSISTQKNINNFRRQLKNLGISFDWKREVNTSDPKYYKWTQWIFLQLFKNGLAYQTKIPVNWCPKCLIGLANEEVIGGKCERCGEQVSKKEIKQWMFQITKYADRLIEDLDKIDYLEKIKIQQKDWIGRSEGTEAIFKIDGSDQSLKIFTTRIDTIFGVTALVLAPEHNLVSVLEENISNLVEVKKYIEKVREKTEFERTNLEKERTGIKLEGVWAVNPVSDQKIEVWLGDYVIGSYGGGAVMMVPAHDRRDYDFAKKYNLPFKEVVKGGDISKEAFVEYGVLTDSERFSGLASEEAIKKIQTWLKENGLGGISIQYKLRDWIFSRQHYWGEPIPIIHCDKCGVVPVPEDQLPVTLPFVEKYQPTGTGESPLAAITEWVNVKCPKCGGQAKRETDTMPNWAGSNWYYMRYCDPQNDQALGSPEKLKYWLPVDWYNGGMEHTTLHLLYSRFIYKFLFDIGAAPSLEPYQKRTSHGMVLSYDGQKMSKSRGNVINPDDIVKEYGADTLRIYELFMGPFDQAIAWNIQGVKGVRRFLDKLYALVLECSQNKESSDQAKRMVHKLNQRITQNIESTKFNTAISGFMEFVNFAADNKKGTGKDSLDRMLLLLSPFAPHLAEELWQKIGNRGSIFQQKWPVFDPALAQAQKINLIIQVNGRMRDKIEADPEISEEEAKAAALASTKIKSWLNGQEPKQIIFVKGRLVNIVV
ncbi:MAG: leucine--tRNA ligase [Candidatus Paceibacterota bacterium]|jgi:leucyl-tRNA synthetase